MNYKFFGVAYAIFGAFLTSGSFIVHRSDLLLEEPFFVFVVSFLIFFVLSFLIKPYFKYLKDSNISSAPLKYTSIFLVLFTILLLINLKSLTNKTFLDEDVYSLPDRLKEVVKFNWILVLIALAVLIVLYIILSYFVEKTKILKKPLIFIIFIAILLSLIPISMLLEKTIRIIILIIELSGGLT